MAGLQTTYTIDVCGPLGDHLRSYDRKQPPRAQGTKAAPIDQTFIDAMVVREEVFVVEQKVPLENELDDDDATCIHLVLYSLTGANESSGKQPAGTIRIIPQHASLHTNFDKHRRMDGTSYHGEVKSSSYNGEPFIKFGRLAVIKQQRGHGYADALVKAALSYAASNPERLLQVTAAGSHVTSRKTPWTGLVLIHAQVQVQKFWERSGFTTDQGLGIWDEEGIDHVAMWARVPLP